MKVYRASRDFNDRDTFNKIQFIQDPGLRQMYLDRLEDQKSASTNKLIAAGLLTAAAPAAAYGANKLGSKLTSKGSKAEGKLVSAVGTVAPLATAATILGHDVLKKKNLVNEIDNTLISQQMPYDYSDETEEESPSKSRKNVESVVSPEENMDTGENKEEEKKDDFSIFESLI